MEKPKLLGSKTLFSGYIEVKEDLLERKDGKTIGYTHFKTPSDAVVIIATNREGKLVLNREYRHPIGSYILGCPGGTLEKNEDPLIGARRELLEETGYWSDELRILGASHQIPALTSQKIYFIEAKNAFLKEGQKLDPFEYIQTELKTQDEIGQDVLSGVVFDGHLLAALALIRFHSESKRSASFFGNEK